MHTDIKTGQLCEAAIPYYPLLWRGQGEDNSQTCLRLVHFILIILSLLLAGRGYAQPDRKFVGNSAEQIFEQTKDSLVILSATGRYMDYIQESYYDSVNNHVFFSDGTTLYRDKFDSVASLKPYMDSLNYLYASTNPSFTPSQSIIALPKKGREYYYIYTTTSDAGLIVDTALDQFDYIIVDLDARGGKGGIKGNRHPLLRQPVQSGHVTATRHANGRDWWLLQKGRLDSMYYIFLVTPDTIVFHHQQAIGRGSRFEPYGYSHFSAQGDKLLYTDVQQLTQVFDFDRCTGWLTGVQVIHTLWYDSWGKILPPDTVPGMLGGVFSPSGRYLYLNNYYALFQYDLQATHVDSSRVLLGLRDSSYTSGNYEVFSNGMLMYDNRVYYADFSGGPKIVGDSRYHVINYPDSPGIKCGFVHDQFHLHNNGMFDFPNMPSYRPGVLVGSGCDTAFTGVQVVTGEWGEAVLEQNPVSDLVSISYRLRADEGCTTLLYDIDGRQISSHTSAGANSMIQLDVAHLAIGTYIARMQTSSGWSQTFKILIAR
jgi:Secretion system C-terminal sorting domain